MLVLLISEHVGAVASDAFADGERGQTEFDALARRVRA